MHSDDILRTCIMPTQIVKRLIVTKHLLSTFLDDNASSENTALSEQSHSYSKI